MLKPIFILFDTIICSTYIFKNVQNNYFLYFVTHIKTQKNIRAKHRIAQHVNLIKRNYRKGLPNLLKTSEKADTKRSSSFMNSIYSLKNMFNMNNLAKPNNLNIFNLLDDSDSQDLSLSKLGRSKASSPKPANAQQNDQNRVNSNTTSASGRVVQSSSARQNMSSSRMVSSQLSSTLSSRSSSMQPHMSSAVLEEDDDEEVEESSVIDEEFLSKMANAMVLHFQNSDDSDFEIIDKPGVDIIQ
ncbi:hypothetical protein COBT_000060 [Conglomerata obtusa]